MGTQFVVSGLNRDFFSCIFLAWRRVATVFLGLPQGCHRKIQRLATTHNPSVSTQSQSE